MKWICTVFGKNPKKKKSFLGHRKQRILATQSDINGNIFGARIVQEISYGTEEELRRVQYLRNSDKSESQ